MKLLLVEDNRPLAYTLKRQLGKHFVIDIARNGSEGLQQVQNGTYDVILLDLGLPDRHGYDVCQDIRKSGTHIPIIILTGTKDLASRVQLLDAGADDYVMKPFSIAELRARIHAVLRRAPADYKHNVLQVQDLVIDPQRRSVTRGGVDITLRRKEFDILEYLARNSGRAVTRSMIFDHVWESGKDSWNNTVDVHIKHLRDKVDRPFNRPLIKTAYGIGYLLNDV